MRRVAAVAFAGLLLLLLVVPATGAKNAKRSGPYTIVPAVGMQTTMSGGTETVTLVREGLTAEISYVTGAPRRRMVEATLGIQLDPFAPPPGSELKLHTVLLSLRNTEGQTRHLNPATCRLVSNTDQVTYGADYTLLYQAFGSGRVLTMEQVQKIVYDRPLTIDPGGKVRKLLVFEEMPGKWDNFLLVIPVETEGLQTFDLSVAFRKVFLDSQS